MIGEHENQRQCGNFVHLSCLVVGALVVQGLTIATSGFNCSEGHYIRRIVVLENDPDREAYIRRQLIAIHDASSEGIQGGARVVEEGTGVGGEDVHIGRTRSEGNFDDDEAEEGELDSGSGKADLGGGAEEDMGDSGDFSDNGFSGDSEDDSIVEGAMAHGGRDRVAQSLEGDVADIGISPSRGRQSLLQTTPVNIVRHSLMHKEPSIRMEKRRRLVHTIESGDEGGPSMLVQWRHR